LQSVSEIRKQVLTEKLQNGGSVFKEYHSYSLFPFLTLFKSQIM